MQLTWACLAMAGMASAANYVEKNNYNRKNFFDAFEFISIKDPTKGKVNYVDRRSANEKHLAGFPKDKDAIFLGVDDTTVNPGGNGRNSVRVSSKKTFNQGLFIFDVNHMPQGCGVWPAIWTFGPGWPHSGEIDIIEGVHNSPFNAVALHTGNGCVMTNKGSMFEGNQDPKIAALTEKGFCGAPNGEGQIGCSQKTNVAGSFGPEFNKNGGGFYAMEWTNKHISVWFFKRGTEPKDLKDKPDPDKWPKPMARFTSGDNGGCNIAEKFKKHNIIINTTLCGEWAGNVWDAEAQSCVAKKAKTCNEHVLQNPKEYTEAFWEITSIKVYQLS